MKNWLTAKPDLKAVFFWIKSLTVHQKRDFNLQFGPSGKQKPKFWVLYECLNQLKDYDEEEIFRIIPQKNFNRRLNRLIEKLIYWQLSAEGAEAPRQFIIKKALEAGAINMVRKYILDELAESVKWNRFSQVMTLLDSAEKLHQLFGINIRLDNPFPFPDRDQIYYMMGEVIVLENTLRKLEFAFLRSPEEREGLINYAWREFRDYFPKRSYMEDLPDIRKRILNHLIQARVEILRGNLKESIFQQSQASTLVSGIPKNPIAESLHEAFVLVHLHVLARNQDDAVAALENMRQLKPQNPLDSTLKFQFIVKAEMVLAERSWDARTAEQILTKLLAQPGAFSGEDYPYLLYKVALIHFINGNYSQSVRRLREVFDLDPEMRNEILVWAELLELACYYSLGDLDTVNRGLKRCRKVVKQSGNDYADLVFRTLKAISHNKAFGRELEVAGPFRNEFREALGKRWSAEDHWYLSLDLWLEARHRKVSCSELHAQGEQEWYWSGQFDKSDLAFSMYRVFYPKPYFLPFIDTNR